MADRVIIVDAHRAGQKVPFHEIKQMMGRVSRSGDKDEGKVDLIVGMSKYEGVEQDIAANKQYLIKSVLAQSVDEISFHAMAEISRGVIKTTADLQNWYERSLSFAQGNKVSFKKIIDHLSACESVITIKSNILPTLLGHASARYYFTPLNIFEWKRNFEEIIGSGNHENTFAICWALANTSGSGGSGFEPKEIIECIEEYKGQISSLRLDYEGNIKDGIGWWYLLGGPPIKGLKAEALQNRKQWARIYRTLRIINRSRKWEKQEYFSDIDVRVINRAPDYLLKLCIAGFNKTTAAELYDMGIEQYEHIHDRLIEILASENLRLVQNVKEVINAHLNKFSKASIKRLSSGDGNRVNVSKSGEGRTSL